MSDPKPTAPIFDLKRSFETTVTIGDATIPIRVKRFTRAQWLEFSAQWDAWMTQPRGDVMLTPEQERERLEKKAAFMERYIVEAITLDPGYIRDDGQDVVNGDGLVNVFFARRDVLFELVKSVLEQNILSPMLRKNSNSPRVSATGSERSIPARGGDSQGPTAASAEKSGSAASAPAAESPDSPAASPSSSGATRDDEEPIVH